MKLQTFMSQMVVT